MELVYLWVKEYKNIKKQGFNFSPRFRCEYDEESKELTIEEKKDYVNIFPENINITAIVGENGSGKSSLLELLFDRYALKNHRIYFLIFYDREKNVLTFHGLGNPISIKESKLPYKKNINKKNIIQKLTNTKIIYYSNILSEYDLVLAKCYMNDIAEKVNLSTAYLLNHNKLIETSFNVVNANSKTDFDKIYRSYRIQEIQRSILAIKDGLSVPFELPEKLIIKNIDFKPYLEKIKNKFNNEVYKKILNIIEKNNDEEILFENYLSTNLVISLILENMNSNNPILEELLEIVLDEKITSELKDFYHNVRKALYNKEFKLNGENVSAIYIDEFFDIADKLLKQMSSFTVLQKSHIKKSQIELIIKNTNFDFLEIYERLIQQSEYFWDISWRGLSSGEETYLYQFSRFYFLKMNYKNDSSMNLKIDNNDVENIILLIDEGEITLHPQWQKSYITFLVKFLEKNFSQNIHLILTSHSPFILSDLPKENVIFLEKDESTGNCINATNKVDINLFGANIHTLLSHGFFMKDGLMGEFAKDKIQSIIKYHEEISKLELTKKENEVRRNEEKKKYEKEHKTMFWQIQSIIGDDYLKQVVKNHLIEIEKIVLGNDEANKEEVKRLKAQIELLEK